MLVPAPHSRSDPVALGWPFPSMPLRERATSRRYFAQLRAAWTVPALNQIVAAGELDSCEVSLGFASNTPES